MSWIDCFSATSGEGKVRNLLSEAHLEASPGNGGVPGLKSARRTASISTWYWIYVISIVPDNTKHVGRKKYWGTYQVLAYSTC